MDTNVIIRTVLGVVVSLIVIVSVAVPIISDLEPVDIENTVTGDISFRPVGTDESFTITIYKHTISYNDVSIELDNSTFCLVSDALVFYLNTNDSRTGYSAIGFDTSTQQYDSVSGASSGTALTINISNGVISTSFFDFSSTFQYMYLADPDGAYGFTNGKRTTTALVSDAVIQFSLDGAIVFVGGDHMVSHVSPGGSSGSYTEPDAVLSDVTRDGDLVTFSTSSSVTLSGSQYWIIPYHVGQEPTPTQNLIQIVPVIMMAGLIIAAVAAC